jgi:hypothetical protein
MNACVLIVKDAFLNIFWIILKEINALNAKLSSEVSL